MRRSYKEALLKGETAMKCPYCGRNMKKGCIRGDGRSGVTWVPEDEKYGVLGRMGLEANISAAESGFFCFKLKGNYCDVCEKLIIDTHISL